MRLNQGTLRILSGLDVDANARAVRITEQLDRADYTKVNAALEAMGGKWNRKAKAHLFEADPTDAIEGAIMTGELVDPKKEFDFFETPPGLARGVVEHAQIKPGHFVLEPSAGRGALASAIADCGRPISVQCCEIQPANRAVLRDLGFAVVADDFLTFAPTTLYNRVVMNPPFSRQRDIDHVSHALKVLAPGGRLVAIMSAGVEFRQNAKTVGFRKVVEAFGGSIHRLEDGSFADSGTMVNTVLVTMEKPS